MLVLHRQGAVSLLAKDISHNDAPLKRQVRELVLGDGPKKCESPVGGGTGRCFFLEFFQGANKGNS